MLNEISAIHALAQRSSIQPVNWPCAHSANCRIWVKRDDLLHPVVSGNKLFKLFHHLKQAAELKSAGLISFGGAYSNHLYALARVAHSLNMPSVGIIRGEECDTQNPTLMDLTAFKMHVQPVSREVYRTKTQEPFLAQLNEKYPGFYVIPEGGAGVLGAQGFVDYAEAVADQLIKAGIVIDSVWLPAGSGTSVAGLAARWQNLQAVCAFATNNPKPFMDEITLLSSQVCQRLQNRITQPHLISWHGFNIPFGKLPESIIDICWAFWQETGVLFDPIYGGKVLLALQKAFENGLRGKNILLLHTGGVQGWRGFLAHKNIPSEFEAALAHYWQGTHSFILNDTDLTLGHI